MSSSTSSSDARPGAIGEKAWLGSAAAETTVPAPGATVYAHVVEFGDNLAIPAYGFQIRPTALSCGDGVLTVVAGEQCDDGNTNPNDGCSATCQIEGTNEVEPNEDGTPQTGGTGVNGNDFDAGGVAVANATAQGVTDVAVTGRTWLAAGMVAFDVDAMGRKHYRVECLDPR